MKRPTKTTRRSVSIFAQIVHQLPGHLIEHLAARQTIRARELSYSTQLHLLMLGQFLHAFSLNELVDISQVHRKELSRIRGITPAKLNTFSNANRTRNPKVAEDYYWMLRDRFSRETPGFRNVRNRGALARFKTRRVFAVDASVIPLSLRSMDWAKYIHRKAAAKLHMRTNVANMLPDFVVIGKGRHHEVARAGDMCADLKAGDIAVVDRGYYDFEWFWSLTERDVTFVTRERGPMNLEVKEDLREDRDDGMIELDQRVELVRERSWDKYPGDFRRIKANVEIDGKVRPLVFVTNNFTWAARTIADLYKSRWTVEVLFKELKQTLQLQSFYGTNEKAVQWQIWAALIVHLVLRYLAFKSRWCGSYSRFVGLIRTAIWMKTDLETLLVFYGIAPPPETHKIRIKAPYLPGFEKAYLDAMGQQSP